MGSPTERAWAAGFFDGEGTTSNEFTRSYPTIKLVVVQVERELLERFNDAIGQLGTLYGPYPRGDNQPISHVVVTGFERTQMTLALLWPYLSAPKKVQATKAMQYFTSRWKPQPISQHGTHSHYSNRKCRCEPCSSAHKAYMREWYQKRKAAV